MDYERRLQCLSPSEHFATAGFWIYTWLLKLDKANSFVGTWRIHDHIHIIDESKSFCQTFRFCRELKKVKIYESVMSQLVLSVVQLCLSIISVLGEKDLSFALS